MSSGIYDNISMITGALLLHFIHLQKERRIKMMRLSCVWGFRNDYSMVPVQVALTAVEVRVRV